MPGCYCPRCTVELSPTAAACAACGFPRPGTGWPQDPVVGKTINDRYRVTGRIGAGGFGIVYRALQRRGNIDLGEVVLKFLQPGLANQPEIRRRFVNEARAARRVHSPHVVTIFDLDFDHDGMPFMVMELLRGESLKQVLAVEGRLAAFRVCRIGIQAAGALEACHRAGVVHRDLKPSNLLLLEGHATDFIKIIDFGIARVPNPEESLTTQAMLGTPRYMAPEQVRQGPIDYRADLFALGVLLYVALAGEPPIPAQGAIECMQRNLDTEPIPLRVRCPELPPDLEQLLAEMMAKDRARRPASMTAVEQELRRIGVASGWVREDSLPMAAADPSTSRSLTAPLSLAGAGRRRSPALLVAIAVAVIGLPFAGGLLWSRNRASPPSTDARVAATPPDAGPRASGERKDLARAERPSAHERADGRVEPQRTPGKRKKKTLSKGARKGKKKGKDTLIYDEL